MSFAFLPLFTGDYLRDTRHLTPQRHGVYLLALMYCWDSKAPMPLDEQECAGICNCRSADEVDALRYVLSKYFIRMDDGWYNKRIQKEIERGQNISAARSAAGRRGYEAKAKRLPVDNSAQPVDNSAAPVDNFKQLPSNCQAIAEQVSGNCQAIASTPTTTTTTTTKTTTEKIKTNARAAPALVVLPDWIPADAWAAYAEHRKASKKPLTQAGASLAIRKLGEFRTQGFSPQLVLETAVMNGWTGLYAPKQQPAQSRQSALEARNAQVAANWIPPELRTANATK